MKLYPIEATNDVNWGKFAVGRLDGSEWAWRSRIDLETRTPLMRSLGWDATHLWVLDLQTGEGAYFRPGGHAGADLNSHQIWVCPMFEPFLTWLYTQDLTDLEALPRIVELPDAPPEFYGYRRQGPDTIERVAIIAAGENTPAADVAFRTPECP